MRQSLTSYRRALSCIVATQSARPLRLGWELVTGAKWVTGALLALSSFHAAAQTTDLGEEFINAGRAGALVSIGNEALVALLERLPKGQGDEWAPDRTYHVIYGAALELDLLRGRACAGEILKGAVCKRLFRPRWLVPPRPGLYQASQLSRFTFKLIAEVERVQRPVCARALTQKIENICFGIE